MTEHKQPALPSTGTDFPGVGVRFCALRDRRLVLRRVGVRQGGLQELRDRSPG
jgi:hypothetical protein